MRVITPFIEFCDSIDNMELRVALHILSMPVIVACLLGVTSVLLLQSDRWWVYAVGVLMYCTSYIGSLVYTAYTAGYYRVK